MKSQRKVLIIICMIFICIFSTGFTAIENAPSTYGTVNSFNNIKLEDELRSIQGFDWAEYPFSDDKAVKTSIFNVVEYCYTFHANRRLNYGLYIYVYNPHKWNIDTKSGQNMINIGIDWAKDNTWSSIEYHKFKLEFISMTTEPDYAGLFYKFKLVDEKVNDKYLVERLNSNARRYDIAEVELKVEGEQHAHSITGTNYTYEGYAAGCGADINDKTSTLRWTSTELEIIEIGKEDIGMTSYIMPMNNGKENHHDVINSVYFSVPDKILSNYGNLQKVKFTTYQYKTSPIIVTKDRGLYDIVKSNRDKSIEKGFKPDYNFYANYQRVQGGGFHYSDWCFDIPKSNHSDMTTAFKVDRCESYSSHLPFIFNKNYGDKTDDVTAQELLNYIYSYNSSNFNGYLPHRNLSYDLFMGLPKDKQVGKIVKEIDAGDVKNLYNQDLDNWSFWDKLFNKKPTTVPYTIHPIEIVKSGYNKDEMFIHKNDYSVFDSAVSIAKSKDRTMHMFRFAFSDYYSALLHKAPSGISLGFKSLDAYMCQTDAFLDFDIIQLTFNRDGVMKVIPVAMSPLDVISGTMSPAEPKDTIAEILKSILITLAIIACIALLYFLWPVLALGLNVVCTVVALPFKAIGGLFNRGKKSNKVKIELVEPKDTKKRSYNKDDVKRAKERFSVKKKE